MVSFPGPNFKIIDFDFASLDPFNDFVGKYRGTPGYFPKVCKNHNMALMPPIDANDFIPIMYNIPLVNNRKLVYKIDTYCFGRTLLFLYNFYKENITPSCSCFNVYRTRKIERIIDISLEKNVWSRLTINQILSLNII